MLTVIVTIRRDMCAVLTVNVTITVRYICSVNSYYDNNDEVDMQY